MELEMENICHDYRPKKAIALTVKTNIPNKQDGIF